MRDRGTERDEFGREHRLAQIGTDTPTDRTLEAGTLPQEERLRVYESATSYITAADAAALRRVAARYDKPLALRAGFGGSGWAVVAPDGKAFLVEDGEVWAEP